MEIKKTGIRSLEIQEIIQIPLKKLIESTAVNNGRLKWCDGILLSIAGFPGHEKLFRNEIFGKYYWQTVEFCKLDNYTNIIKDDYTNTEVYIYDVSFSPFYQKVAEFLKNYIKDEEGKTDG